MTSPFKLNEALLDRAADCHEDVRKQYRRMFVCAAILGMLVVALTICILVGDETLSCILGLIFGSVAASAVKAERRARTSLRNAQRLMGLARNNIVAEHLKLSRRRQDHHQGLN